MSSYPKWLLSRNQLRQAFWKLAFSTLPTPILFKLWYENRRKHLRVDIETATEKELISFSGGVIAVYWADVPGVGSGPGASLYVQAEEVMRLDCFGSHMGHMHINPEQGHLMYRHGEHMTARLYFPEGSREEHVERATFEMRNNAFVALQMNALPMIQKHKLDKNDLMQATAQMHQAMMHLIKSKAQDSKVLSSLNT